MKIILNQEVTGLGEAGDIVEVRDGYGRNYLLPRGLAAPWTKGAQKQVDQMRAARKKLEIESRETAVAMKGQLESRVIRLKAKAGKDGRLFGAVTPAMVADAIKDEGIGTVDKRKVEIPNHVKSVGQFSALVRLHPEIQAQLTCDVTAE